MKYIFPRQFGLHNVFTSAVDPTETAQRFKDYTIRDQEISGIEYVKGLKTKTPDADVKKLPPKRLRGKLPVLISRLRKLHSQCPYVELLNHYCPAEVSSSHSRYYQCL